MYPNVIKCNTFIHTDFRRANKYETAYSNHITDSGS